MAHVWRNRDQRAFVPHTLGSLLNYLKNGGEDGMGWDGGLGTG